MDAASALSAGLDEADIHHGFVHPLEEPVQIKGFAVTDDRKFNLGNFETLNPVPGRAGRRQPLGGHYRRPVYGRFCSAMRYLAHGDILQPGPPNARISLITPSTIWPYMTNR